MTADQERLKAEAEFQNQRMRNIAEGHAEARDRFYYLADRAGRHYESLLQDVAGKSVVVVGCSAGGVTPLARRGAKKVIGIDISDEAIEQLRRAIARENLQQIASAELMDAHNLSVADRSQDVICCTGVLHHLDVELAAASWARKLKSDGKVYMQEPMALNPAIALFRALTPSMRTKDEHPLLPRDIAILRKHFGRVEVHGYVLTSLLSLIWAYLPNVFSLRERSLAVLERLDDLLLKICPPLSYLCWTSVIVLADPRGETTKAVQPAMQPA